MRRVLLVVVLGLLLGAGLMALIERDPGLVVISYGDTTVETSVWLALVLWLLVWGLLAFSLRLLRGAWTLRGSVSGWLGGRKARNASALTNRGLISFIEGNWSRSRRQLLRAARYSKAPLLNYLMAARASFRLGDNESMQRYLGEAERVESDARIALELTQAELQLNAGHNEQALATLVRARDNASRHPYVLELLATAHARLEDWSALQALLPELRKAAVLEETRMRDLELSTWRGLLRAHCRNDEDPVDEVTRLWAKIPRALAQESPMLRECYVDCLIQHQGWEKAQRFIVNAVEREWDSGLASRLGQFPVNHPQKLLKAVRRWLESHPSDARLLLVAARVALQAGEKPAAIEWLETALARQPDPVVCLELARLREADGEVKAARRLTQQAAELAVGPLPILVQPEGS
ncbi:MAG: heme biosynthesis HemY N-terminal domain-containing protein [Halieaceae bacterium]|jgi:HemY protein|nr:heme biosynthesis HemY N-terminal domain-containing protein [Halieaceae bacterium]